jgi:hypothetical protein
MVFMEQGSVAWTNVKVWHRLPGAPLRNRVKGWSQEGHFNSGRVAGCPPPACSVSHDILDVTSFLVLESSAKLG